MPTNEFEFTYDNLKGFLTYAQNIAPVIPLREWNRQSSIILRHDVDLDIYPAYCLSQLEKDIGVRSTFFIMVTSYTYNPSSPVNCKLLRKMACGGFEIGLHFDPKVYGDLPLDVLGEKVNSEAQLLEGIINEPVNSVSLHNPSSTGKYPVFKEFNNAYSKEIFNDDCYLSDSCYQFRGKDPYNFVAKADRMTLQILLHPEHWSEEGGDYISMFSRYMRNLAGNIDHVYSAGNSTYRSCLANSKLSDILLKELEP